MGSSSSFSTQSSSDSDDLKTSFSLLAKAQAEDPAAWRRIVHLYTPLIDYWIRRRGISNHDLENMRQEVFTRISTSLSSFSRDRGGSFRGWLRRVTNNLITNHQQRRNDPLFVDSSTANLLLDNLAIVTPDVRTLFEPEVDEDPHETILLSRQIMSWVRNSHPALQAEIFELLVVQDQSPAEIAESKNVRVAFVYQTKSRILAKIRRYFGELL